MKFKIFAIIVAVLVLISLWTSCSKLPQQEQGGAQNAESQESQEIQEKQEEPWAPENEEIMLALINGRIFGDDFNWFESKEGGIEFYFGDSGETVKFPYGDRNGYSVAPFVSGSIAAAAVRTCEGDTKTVKIYTSTDRGETWNVGEIALEGTEPMEHAPNLYFLNTKIGYYLMEINMAETRIYKTEDGGLTWNKAAETAENLYGIHSFGGKIWLYGEAENIPVLYKTDENITALEEIKLDFGEKEYSSLWPISDALRSHGEIGVFAIAGRDNKEDRMDKFFVTEDGGETWHEFEITE